jgi:hypothetical protein
MKANRSILNRKQDVTPRLPAPCTPASENRHFYAGKEAVFGLKTSRFFTKASLADKKIIKMGAERNGEPYIPHSPSRSGEGSVQPNFILLPFTSCDGFGVYRRQEG